MSSKPSKIAQKEVILTRNKSAQLKRQLRNKKSNATTISLLKSPSATKKRKPVQSGNTGSSPAPQKQKALSQVQKSKVVPADNRRFAVKKNIIQVDDGKLMVTKGNKCYASPKRLKKANKDNLLYQEYYPNCTKRISDVKKVILKPKHQLMIIGATNKRKRCIPQKDVCYSLEDRDMWNQEPGHGDGADNRKLRIDELIHLSENNLTDEDLLEILTCPSPVWWEDPTNDEYTEDAVLYSSRDNAMDIDEIDHEKLPIADRAGKNNEINTKNVDLLKSDKKFMKKRNKLENLLSCIKNKNVGSNNDKASGKFKHLKTKEYVDDSIDKDVNDGDGEMALEIIKDEDSSGLNDIKINDTQIADKKFIQDYDSSDDVVESIKNELIDTKKVGEEIINGENSCENSVEIIEKMETDVKAGKEIIYHEDDNENMDDANVNKRPDSVISSKRSNSDSECDIFNDEKFEEMLTNLENIDIPIKDENLNHSENGGTSAEIHLTDANKFQNDDSDFKIVLIESDEELKFKSPDKTVLKEETNVIDDEIPKNLPPLTKCPSNLYARKSSTDYQDDSSSVGSSQDIDYTISDANIRFLTDVESGTEKSLSSDEYRIAKKGIGGLKKLNQVVIPVSGKNNNIKHYNENGTIIIGNKDFINVYKIVDDKKAETVETTVNCNKNNNFNKGVGKKVTKGVTGELDKMDTGNFSSNSLLKKNYSVH